MSITFGLAIYFVIWWTVLFAVLPFGVRTQDEDGSVVPGTPGIAPTRPRLLRIFLINTAVASIVYAIVYVVIVYKLVTPETLPFP